MLKTIELFRILRMLFIYSFIPLVPASLAQEKPKESINLTVREFNILSAIMKDTSVQGEKDVQAAVSLLASFKILAAQKDSMRVLQVDQPERMLCLRAITEQIAKGFKLEYAVEVKTLRDKFSLKEKK